MHRIFVYGTLKRGFCRHGAISAQTFLGLAKTEPNYKLFDLGSYPGLIFAEEGKTVEGELYDVDDACLEQLDRIEGVAEGLYVRGEVRFLSPLNIEPAQTYFYLPPINDHIEISHWSKN